MTVGERIKYCRKTLGITQSELAKITGIHPVSIRKYETNKAQPQPPQIEKIADALNISYNALSVFSDTAFRLETVGDLMGIILAFCNSGVFHICGDRGADGLIDISTASIQLSSSLAPYFEIKTCSGSNQQSLSLNDIIITIKHFDLLTKLLQWEQMNYFYYATSFSPDVTEKSFSDFTTQKEVCEIELQRSSVLLNTNGKREVKINPNYHH